MTYGHDINTGQPLTAKEYADKLRAINDAIKGKVPKCPSLFDKAR